eukprot:1887615-Rhodomonas_salina.1
MQLYAHTPLDTDPATYLDAHRNIPYMYLNIVSARVDLCSNIRPGIRVLRVPARAYARTGIRVVYRCEH